MKEAIIFERKTWTWPCPDCGYFNEEKDDPTENILICPDCGSRFKPKLDRFTANDLDKIAVSSMKTDVH